MLCRSSSNSLGRRSYGFSGLPPVGGSLRLHSTRSPHSYTFAPEQESLLSHPAHSHHPLPPHHPPPPPFFLSRHFAARRDRRALSLELPELFRAGGQPPGLPPIHPDAGKRSGSGAGGSITGGSVAGSGLGVDHRDCNGKAPGPHTQLMVEVFPQVNARKDRTDLDEETDYVSGLLPALWSAVVHLLWSIFNDKQQVLVIAVLINRNNHRNSLNSSLSHYYSEIQALRKTHGCWWRKDLAK